MTLAEELRDRGAEVRFVCREQTGNMISALQKAGYWVEVLHIPLTSSESGADFGGVAEADMDQLMDARQTIDALKGFKCDWMIEDHYQLDVTWENCLRPFTGRLLVIDDLANRSHCCDVLVDPAYGGLSDRYAGLLNPDAICLCGSQYALLRRQFALCRPASPKHFSQRGELRIHLFFGSTDHANHTVRFGDLLLMNFERLRVRVVVGKDYAYLSQFAELQKRYGTRFAWERDVVDMAANMAECDIAVGAPGGATWERAALGLPSAYLAVTKNQTAILEHLSASGLCKYLGSASELGDDEFLAEMGHFITDTQCLEQLSRQGMVAVDAMGAHRVADILERNL